MPTGLKRNDDDDDDNDNDNDNDNDELKMFPHTYNYEALPGWVACQNLKMSLVGTFLFYLSSMVGEINSLDFAVFCGCFI